ncbi:MAG: DUF1330 domain-containing protein [Candidatus Competibacteraceae bacterium]|nr:DUF1330 domain-containing protein [Candidatus Competibacteraceae bacterium]
MPESIAAYGGRYLVRGGQCETLEGSWSPQRVVVLEFAFAVSNMVVVEGRGG